MGVALTPQYTTAAWKRFGTDKYDSVAKTTKREELFKIWDEEQTTFRQLTDAELSEMFERMRMWYWLMIDIDAGAAFRNARFTIANWARWSAGTVNAHFCGTAACAAGFLVLSGVVGQPKLVVDDNYSDGGYILINGVEPEEKCRDVRRDWNLNGFIWEFIVSPPEYEWLDMVSPSYVRPIHSAMHIGFVIQSLLVPYMVDRGLKASSDVIDWDIRANNMVMPWSGHDKVFADDQITRAERVDSITDAEDLDLEA
jgi:hypothetical protein